MPHRSIYFPIRQSGYVGKCMNYFNSLNCPETPMQGVGEQAKGTVVGTLAHALGPRGRGTPLASLEARSPLGHPIPAQPGLTPGAAFLFSCQAPQAALCWGGRSTPMPRVTGFLPSNPNHWSHSWHLTWPSGSQKVQPAPPNEPSLFLKTPSRCSPSVSPNPKRHAAGTPTPCFISAGQMTGW